MPENILTQTQLTLLKAIGQEPFFQMNFYLTGGTALAGFYLHHRYSEDLDFFSEDEVDTLPIISFFEKRKGGLGITSMTSQTSLNRNLFFLKIGGETIKMEFTYFPFPRMEASREQFGVPVDSAKDIAVNKLFTIYQRNKARDYIDLYCLCGQYGWSVQQLISWAKLKFDWHIDPVQLATQFVRAATAKDYPRMIAPITEKAWQDFFKNEAIKLKPNILG